MPEVDAWKSYVMFIFYIYIYVFFCGDAEGGQVEHETLGSPAWGNMQNIGREGFVWDFMFLCVRVDRISQVASVEDPLYRKCTT